MKERNFESVTAHHSRVENWLAIIGVLLAAFAVGASIAAMTGCAASTIDIGGDASRKGGVHISDSNLIGDSAVSWVKVHRTATTFDMEAADYGKTKGSAVAALGIAAGAATLMQTGNPALATAVGGLAAAGGSMMSSAPTTQTTTAVVAPMLIKQAEADAAAAAARGK